MNRAGKEALFPIEAKSGRPGGSLAKHKLVYPFAALRTTVPDYMEIVPVYLKVWSEDDGQHFLVCECELPATSPSVVSELTVRSTNHLILHGYGGR